MLVGVYGVAVVQFVLGTEDLAGNKQTIVSLMAPVECSMGGTGNKHKWGSYSQPSAVLKGWGGTGPGDASLYSQQIGDKPGLQSEFKASLGNLVKPCLKIKSQNENIKWVRVLCLHYPRLIPCTMPPSNPCTPNQFGREAWLDPPLWHRERGE